MKWIYGDKPTENGIYLCAIAGKSNPVVLGWFNGNWVVNDHIPIINKPNVLYYMNPSDVSMPEGW